MSDEHERMSTHWAEAEKMTKARQFVERSDMKAWAAFSVGGLSFAGLLCQELTRNGPTQLGDALKLLAAFLGTLLPLVFIVATFRRTGHFNEINKDLDTLKARRRLAETDKRA